METVPGSGMPPASLLWTRIASTEIIYSCGFDFMTVPGRIATGKYCQHTPRSGELLRALYTGRSSDSGIKHSCSSSQGTASMSCEQLLCQHSNGFVRDLHPFPVYNVRKWERDFPRALCPDPDVLRFPVQKACNFFRRCKILTLSPLSLFPAFKPLCFCHAALFHLHAVLWLCQ